MAKINKQNSDSYTNPVTSKHISTLSKRDELLIKILSEIGCTVSELVNIKVEDIKTNSIFVGKQRRKVEMSTLLYEKIRKYTNTNSSEFLFSSRQSKKLNIRRVQQIIKKNLGIKPGTIRSEKIIDLAKEKGIEKTKSITGLKGLKIKSFLKNDEIQILKNSIKDDRHSIYFSVLLETGCTISELVNLKVEDIKTSTILIGVPKRNVSVNDELISRIKKLINEKSVEGHIFKSRQSGQISDTRVFQILQNYGKTNNIELNPQILRNTKIAVMLQFGIDKATIERELGIKRLEFGSYGLLNKNG
jgi:integrase